jgi:hypothetical protein
MVDLLIAVGFVAMVMAPCVVSYMVLPSVLAEEDEFFG